MIIHIKKGDDVSNASTGPLHLWVETSVTGAPTGDVPDWTEETNLPNSKAGNYFTPDYPGNFWDVMKMADQDGVWVARKHTGSDQVDAGDTWYQAFESEEEAEAVTGGTLPGTLAVVTNPLTAVANSITAFLPDSVQDFLNKKVMGLTIMTIILLLIILILVNKYLLGVKLPLPAFMSSLNP